MDSFYGGLNGQSFAVKTIFTSYLALQSDLSKAWSSPVSVGEYVLISYGMPSDTSYDAYKQVDISQYGKTYNSTLWQKTYDESANGNANGLSYKLLASMTGNTPKITLTDAVVLDADEDPTVTVDSSDVDYYNLTFSLPQSQILHLGTTVVEHCDVEPSIAWDEEDINNPIITFTLPRSQVIEEAIGTWIDAGEEPTVKLDIGLNDGDTGTIDNPILRFELPVAQTWQQGDIVVLNANEDPYFTVTSDSEDANIKIISFYLPQSQILALGETLIVDANVNPSVEYDDTDINNPTITFSLPQPQVMQQPTTTVAGSTTSPSVTLNDTDINKPYLQFTLPRAANIEVGTLDEDSTSAAVAIPDGVTLEDGDFYLNSESGYLYKVENGELYFKASLQVPKPEIGDTVAIDPYTDTGEINSPTVEMTATSTGWTLTFSLPTAPDITASYETVGVEEEGSVSTEIIDSRTVRFNFSLPRGANIYAGAAVSEYVTSTSIDGVKAGDLYINTDTGYVFKLDDTGTWVQQDGSLQGPAGDTLRFVASYSLTETDSYENTPQNTFDYIEATYTETIYQNDIFSVTWTDESGDTLDYWCFIKSDGAWSRVQLTGGVASLIASEYIEDENKTYSTIYINALIGITGAAGEDKDLKTYSATQIDELIAELNTALSDLDEKIETVQTNVNEAVAQLTEDVATQLETLESNIDTKLSWGAFSDLA